MRIGAYEILAKLGEGGMGAVYRARDTKLNREVALKVLLPAVANDSDRLARFSREAQVLASLNHPHIAAIYGLEDAGATKALVMELVEGEDLSARIARGPIPLDDALPIARQIAEALEAAHEQAIVHRDLKPANIKVRDDGTVKVLDFGLAKAIEPVAPGRGEAMQAATITSPAMTQAGAILGTAAYMAPEQAKGRPVDKRADIWAFGAVLYEMLTGRRAFEGEDIADVLSRVLQREPDVSALPSTTPPAVRALIARCLIKDPRQRLRDIGDARLVLDGAFDTPAAAATGEGPAPRKGGGRGRLALAAAGLASAVALGFMAATWRTPSAAEPQVIRSYVALPETSQARIPGESIALSPDGRRLAFVYPDASGRDVVWVRTLGSADAQPLAGTEGAIEPFWSPDSRYLAFTAGGKLKRVDTTGGSVVTLADKAGGPGDWGRDGVLLFHNVNVEVKRVSADGGDASVVPGRTRFLPSFLPDGRHYLYNSDRKAYVGALDSADGALLLEGVGNAKYADGHVFFMRDTTLYAQPFDAERLSLTGVAAAVAERVRTNPINGAGVFSVSAGGVLAYVANSATMSRLTWFDRSGRETGTLGDPATFSALHLSRNGLWVAASLSRPSDARRDVWVADVRQGVLTQVTSGDADHTDPVLSPDGSRVVFGVRRGDTSTLEARRLADPAVEPVLDGNAVMSPQDWSADARQLLFVRPADGTLSTLPLGERTPVPLPVRFTERRQGRAAFSPDGRWLVYESLLYSMSGDAQRDVFITPFPAGGVARPVTTAGGMNPHWGPDGREIFYLKESTLMRAAVSASGAALEIGTATPLFDIGARLGGLTSGRDPFSTSNLYSVSPDGQRFLFAVPLRVAPETISLVVNWRAALRDTSAVGR